MKKGQLKTEVVKILKALINNIEESKHDYESEDFKCLLGEAAAYYDLYLYKKDRRIIEAQRLEKDITPKYEEGLRDRIRQYLDEY